MKIGLLSYHKNYNYGWNLQCYALLSVLKSLGHDVVYIDKRLFSRKKTLIGCVKILDDVNATFGLRLIFAGIHLKRYNMIMNAS